MSEAFPGLELAAIHPISRRHLEVLRGDLGILQHANRSKPDPARGHSVDDVARALEVDLLHARTLGWDAVAASAQQHLQFLEDAFDEPSGRFRTFRSIDGGWLDGPGTNESLGRAMLALGETIAAAPDPEILERSIELFIRGIRVASRLKSPRAQASIVLAADAVGQSIALAASTDRRDIALMRDVRELKSRLATDLHAAFLTYARPGWPWPEETLTEENALLPRALIVASNRGRSEVMLGIGLQVLDWLIAIQTSPDGHLSPLGNGGWTMGGERSRFDQQPIEATSLLLAAKAAYEATGQPRYRATMERAYAWFLGANDLGKPLAHPVRGAGAEGLTPKGVNRNEGAESTLMWLMAAEHIRAIRGSKPGVVMPSAPGHGARTVPGTMLGVSTDTGASN